MGKVGIALALGGIGLAIFYISKLGKVAADARDAIAAPIADAIAKVTVGDPIKLNGNVRLPDQRVIPLAEIGRVSKIDAGGFFTYGGIRYRIQPGFLSNGDRQAVRA